MRRDSHRYFKSYCLNLQRIGLAELIDEHRRQMEQRAWRASLVRPSVLVVDGNPAALLAG